MRRDLVIERQRNYDLKDGTSRRSFLTSSKSLNGPFWLESLAMALYVRERDIDPETVWIKSETGLILIGDQNEHHPDGAEEGFEYWPDFEVGYRNGQSSIVEIKSAKRRGDPVLEARMARVGERCREADRGFELIFSDRLYRQPKRRNVALIHYYQDTPVSELELNQVLRQLDREPAMQISGLVRACPGITPQKLYALTAKGYLWVNLFKLVNETALIRRRLPISLAA
jgi:hypothetical protein